MRPIRQPNSSRHFKVPSFRSTIIMLLVCAVAFAIGLNFNNLISDATDHLEFVDDDKTIYTPSSTIRGRSNDFKLANKQSFGFFNDISSNQWLIHQEIVANYQPHKNPEDPLEFVPGHAKRKISYFNSPQAFYQTNYEPNFSCALERRIGGNGNGDGPKWICDPHRIKRLSMERKRATGGKEGCLVYSIGSNGDFQFETGLQELLGKDVCEIHIFDYGDYQSVTPKDMNIYYHQWGLKKANQNDGKSDDGFYSIEEIVKKLGHDKRTIDIFKIDCDKCEWRTHGDWFGPNVPMMQQILVETHMTPKDRVLPFFDGIMGQGYVMFHKEPNIQFGEGDSVEFGFLKLHDSFFTDVDAQKKSLIK